MLFELNVWRDACVCGGCFVMDKLKVQIFCKVYILCKIAVTGLRKNMMKLYALNSVQSCTVAHNEHARQAFLKQFNGK